MIKKTEKTDVAELIKKANELKIESSIILDHIAENDLKGLAALIDTEKEKIEERQGVVEFVKGSSLNKQEKNALGLWYANSLRGWNLFTDASTKWLIPMAELVMTPEFQEFMESDKRLADVQKFVRFLESK